MRLICSTTYLDHMMRIDMTEGNYPKNRIIILILIDSNGAFWEHNRSSKQSRKLNRLTNFPYNEMIDNNRCEEPKHLTICWNWWWEGCKEIQNEINFVKPELCSLPDNISTLIFSCQIVVPQFTATPCGIYGDCEWNKIIIYNIIRYEMWKRSLF